MVRVLSKKIYDFLLAVLFFQMILLPKLYMWGKVGILFILLVYCLCLRKMVLRLDRSLILLLVYILWNIICILRGALNGYVYASFRGGTMDVLWPLSSFILASIGLDNKEVKFLHRILIYSTLFFCIIDLCVIITGLLDNREFIDVLNRVNLKQIVLVKENGLINLRTDHQYFYAFLTPYVTAVWANCMMGKSESKGRDKVLITMTMILAMLVSVLSGLGGIWLAISLGVILCLMRYHLFTKRVLLFVAIILIMIVPLFCLKSFLSKGMVYSISQAIASKLVHFGKNGQESVRVSQIRSMLRVWIEAPVFGKGCGYPVSYQRNNAYVTTTSNEMGYFITLYQKGMLGLSLFIMVVFCAINRLRKCVTVSGFAEAFSIGMICFLISNTFNPYLSNLSHVWILYLPFLLQRESGDIDIKTKTTEKVRKL